MERVDADLVPFAQNNPSGYRFAFGTDTETDDINVNYNDNIKKGWGTTPNEFPEVEDFNAMAYTSGYLLSYLYQMGIAEWNDKQKYRQYSRVIGSDGIIYKAKTGTDVSPNVNNNPTSDTTNWEIDNQTTINTLTAKATPIDTDNLGIQEVGGLFKKISWANIKATLKTYYDGLYVPKTTMTDNRAVRANGTGGEIQDSDVIIDDNGNVTIEADSSDARKFSITGGTGNKQGYIFLGNGSVSNTSYGIISDQSTLKIKKAAWNIATDSDLTTSWTDLIEIGNTGKLLIKTPAKIGYGAGSGGDVTQVTSKTTAVTINTPTGRIITHNASLAAGASVKFTVNNSLMDSIDSVTVNARNFQNYEAICTNVTTGNFTVKLTNTSGGSLSEAVGITFNINNGSLN